MTTDQINHLAPVDHLVTDYATVTQQEGHKVQDAHPDATYGKVFEHPVTGEHLATVVPSTTTARAAGERRYRVFLIDGCRSQLVGCLDSLVAAGYLALAHASELTYQRCVEEG